jgi:hypothetical protein
MSLPAPPDDGSPGTGPTRHGGTDVPRPHGDLEAGHDHGVRSEEDHVPALRLALVGAAALLVFFVGSWITVGYFGARMQARGPITIPPEIGLSKINLVEQQPFAQAVRGERSKARQLQRLGSYGWVDRKAGVAHIPIEEAMRLVASGVRPGPETGAPAPGGQP